MSKDEYLITDAPLKALTVFAMPMILGSFFQQIYRMTQCCIGGPISWAFLFCLCTTFFQRCLLP